MLHGPKTEFSGVLSSWRGWRSGIGWVAMASLLCSSNCNSLWDPFLLGRCENGLACGLDMPGGGASDMLPQGSLDSAGTQPSLFGAARHFSVGSAPSWVATGDFNGDLKLDLAVANNNSNDVSVLFGDGAGGFGTAVHFPVGSRPYSVALDDLDGDKKLDIVCTNSGSANVSVLFGNGVGGFDAAANFPVGTAPSSVPSSVAVGDFNGDLKPDLAVGNFQSNNVSVLFGNGSRGFGSVTNLSVIGSAFQVVVADFNRDLKPDLAVAVYSPGNVRVLLGKGGGLFEAAEDLPIVTNVDSVAVGDFNGDMKPDLAVASRFNVSTLLGTGTGSFSVASNFPVGDENRFVALGDANPNYDPFHLAYIGNGGMGHEGCEGNPQRNREQRLPRTLQRTTRAA